MNVRSHMVDLTVESQHVREVVATIFHTVILHRCFGKISYKKESTYSIGKWTLHKTQHITTTELPNYRTTELHYKGYNR